MKHVFAVNFDIKIVILSILFSTYESWKMKKSSSSFKFSISSASSGPVLKALQGSEK